MNPYGYKGISKLEVLKLSVPTPSVPVGPTLPLLADSHLLALYDRLGRAGHELPAGRRLRLRLLVRLRAGDGGTPVTDTAPDTEHTRAHAGHQGIKDSKPLRRHDFNKSEENYVKPIHEYALGKLRLNIYIRDTHLEQHW